MTYGLMLTEKKTLRDGSRKENKFTKKEKSKEEAESQEWTARPT